MLLGMPVIGIAFTEMSKTVQDGASGHLDTDVGELTKRMQSLLD